MNPVVYEGLTFKKTELKHEGAFSVSVSRLYLDINTNSEGIETSCERSPSSVTHHVRQQCLDPLIHPHVLFTTGSSLYKKSASDINLEIIKQ